jgi:hypothetical protein
MIGYLEGGETDKSILSKAFWLFEMNGFVMIWRNLVPTVHILSKFILWATCLSFSLINYPTLNLFLALYVYSTFLNLICSEVWKYSNLILKFYLLHLQVDALNAIHYFPKSKRYSITRKNVFCKCDWICFTSSLE